MNKNLLLKLYEYYWDLEELKSHMDIETIIDCDDEYIYLNNGEKMNVEGDIV